MVGHSKKMLKHEEIPEIPKVNDIPEPGVENVESSKLEWGPELDQMFLSEVMVEIEKLNKGLAKGEKPWRLPTKDELVAEFNKTGSTPAGFRKDFYWSSSVSPLGPTYSCIVNMRDGGLLSDGVFSPTLSRLVR